MNTHVNFEIAKLLKEKGFDIGFGNGQKFYFPDTKELTENYRGNNYPAPTIADVVMWLYEKHEIWISVETSRIGRFNYRLFKKEKSKLIMPFTFEVINAGYDYKSPTEAYEAAIESTYLELEKEQVGQRSEQLIGFLKDYQKSCELMHVSKIDAKNFVDHWNPIN